MIRFAVLQTVLTNAVSDNTERVIKPDLPMRFKLNVQGLFLSGEIPEGQSLEGHQYRTGWRMQPVCGLRQRGSEPGGCGVRPDAILRFVRDSIDTICGRVINARRAVHTTLRSTDFKSQITCFPAYT